MNRERVREHDRERPRERGAGSRDFDALRDVGDFRAVRLADLAKQRYAGAVGGIDKMLRTGYLRREWYIDPRVSKQPLDVLTVGPKGREALRREDPERSVALVRYRDLAHDADVYAAVGEVSERLKREGAVVVRTIPGEALAGERARLANRPRGEWRRNPPASLKRQQEIAEALNLRVVDGRVLIPDARVLYLDGDGTPRQIDVEVTTPTYGRSERGAKTRAGFYLVPGVSFTHSRKVYDGR